MDEIQYSSWLLERLSLGEVYRLRVGSSTIGRHPSSVIRILGSQYVSRHHAQIEVSEEDNLIRIEDLQSVNGIFVNDVHYIQKSVTLKPGDKIGIGVVVDEDVENVDPRHPVFILKYSPLSSRNACSRTRPCPLSIKEMRLSRARVLNNPAESSENSKEVVPSSVCDTASTPKCCIVISDDDDDDEDEKKLASSAKKVDSKHPRERNSSVPETSVSRTDDRTNDEEEPSTSQYVRNSESPNNKSPPTIPADSEKSPAETSTEMLRSDQIKVELNNPSPEDLLPPAMESIKQVPISSGLESDACENTLNPELPKSSLNAASESNESAYTSTAHMPIISSVKQERVRSISAEIQNIFGETDDVIMEKLKDINPYVYNEFNPKIAEDGTNYLADGDCINLLSDDECEQIGQVYEADCNKQANEETAQGCSSKPKSPQKSDSPQLFDQSITDSNKRVTSELNKKEDTQGKGSAKDTETNNLAKEDESSKSEAGDDEELMFSQIVINDMKAELADENIDDFVDDLERVVDEIDFSNEPQENNAVQIQPPLSVSDRSTLCWSIEDSNDDYDAELETKVNDWSAKLFSQTLTQTNMSQVYELDDEEENEDAKAELDDGSAEDDNDYNLDFYTRHDDEVEEVMDELYVALKEKCSPAEDKEIKSSTALIEEIPSSVNENPFYFSPLNISKTKARKRILDSTDDEYNSGIEEPESDLEKQTTRVKRTDASISAGTNYDRKTENKVDDEIGDSGLRRESVQSDKSSGERPENVSVKPNKTIEKIDKIHNTSTFNKNTDQSETSASRPENIKLPANKQPLVSQEARKFKSSSVSRLPPTIIEAPKLPKHRGKLRGVTAGGSDATKQKLNTVREKIRHEDIQKDLKKKWRDSKFNSFKNRDKEQTKDIKESRKERLKIIADRDQKILDISRKRKASNEHKLEDPSKKPKVKVTTVNRGAFLTVEPEKPKPYKIPKKCAPECANPNTKGCATGEELFTANSSKDSSKSTSSRNTEGSLTLFEETLNACDQLNTKKSKQCMPQSFSDSAHSARPAHSGHSALSAPSVSKASAAARAVRTTNKITFASMQRNTFETHQNQKKLAFFSNTRSCLKNQSRTDRTVEQNKKQVRFNDTPEIFYIERMHGAKKVDKKDVMPKSTINDRRQMIRQAYPVLDCTGDIISQCLAWGNEWLENRNSEAQAALETILPIPNQFTSFENYKNIFFPLMKLEFLSVIERDYKEEAFKPFKVTLGYVTDVENRLMLITKCRPDAPKCDLVILDFNDKHTGTFAYVSKGRRNNGAFNTLVFEILPKNYTKAYLGCIKEITVRPVIDNIRIEFGAFNAVFQLESTPLFQKILNPLELLKSKSVPQRNIRYRGFDRLNAKQEQILLSTYAKIIDETTPNITLIKGPPGTGKSCIISNLALQTLYGEEVRCMDKKILICAQSNVAVDVIAAKLYDIQQRMREEIRFRLIRYGIPDRICPEIAPIALQNVVRRDQMKKLAAYNKNIQFEDKENLKNEMRLLKAQIADMENRNVKGTVEEVELIEKKKQLVLFHNILNQVMRPEDERSAYTWYLTNANIVCTTLSSCVKLLNYVDYFDICIIDEATQCVEPWTLLPLKFGINSLVLVGDTQQLPATVLSKKAMSLGFGNSMFTRMQRCLETVQTKPANSLSGIIFGLQTQYRMHSEICKWPNLYFYKNELINGEITHSFRTKIAPFSIINLAYSQNKHCNDGKISNDLEAEFVAKLLKALDTYIPNKYNSYGVITPYAQHRKQLETSLKASGLANIMVNTIDSYQGLEKDVIIISNARTQGVGFLSNYQRLNVALTRPKKCLILCGNFKNLETVPTWRSLLNNARERNLYHEISAECALDIQHNVIEKIKIKP